MAASEILSILGSKVLLIKTQEKILETFVESILLHSLLTIACRKADDSKLKTAQNTARRMLLGLYSRRQISVTVLTEKGSEKL